MNLNVSIVVPAYNAAGTIRKTIEGCLAQHYTGSGIEVVVVDDGSTDDTGRIAGSYPVKYIHQKNAGPAAARNKGFRAASGAVVCFIDSDCIPPPDWVGRLTGHFTTEAIAGCGGSYDILNKNSLIALCIHQDILYRHERIPRECRFLGSYNVAFRKRVLEEVSGFNEEYPIASGEDNDLSYKIIKKGYKLIFDPEIKVFHRHPDSLARFLRQQFWRGFWRMKLYLEHPKMIKGDDYSGFRDYLQPPLFLVLIFLLLFIWFRPAGIGAAALTVFAIILQFPVCASALKRTKELRYLAMIPLNFLRGFAWAGGMVLGILVFHRKKRVGQ